MYKTFREIWTCGFSDMRADTHVDIQTHSSQYFAPLQGAK